jgi:hypothetical protein
MILRIVYFRQLPRVYKLNSRSQLFKKQNSASEVYRLSGHRLSAKLAPTFAVLRVSHGQRTTVNLDFLVGSATFIIQTAPQLSSQD